MAERKRRTTSVKNTEAEAKKYVDLSKSKWVINRAHEFDNGNVSFDMTIGDTIKLYRLVVVTAKDDHQFISFPQYQSNGKWYNYYYLPLTDDDQNAIIDAVYDSLGE